MRPGTRPSILSPRDSPAIRDEDGPNVALLLGPAHVPDREVMLGIAAYAQRHTAWRLVNYRDRHPAVGRQPGWPIQGVIGRGEPAWLDALRARHGPIPVVTVPRDLDRPELNVVSEDADAVARLAVGHLREMGIDRFAMAGFPAGQAASDRLAAALSRAAADELTGSFRQHMVQPSAWLEAASRWLHSLPRPVGVVAFHDAFAEWLIDAARLLGVGVPREVAILSVQNDEMICDLTTPRLSSVDLDLERVGYEAAALLDRLLSDDSGDEPVHWRLPPRGVIGRGSTDRREALDPLLVEAMEQVDQRLTRGVTVAGLARALGASRRHLERKFDAIGTSPRRFIERRRLERARDMLVYSDSAIATIASELGYPSPARFAAAFRGRFGRSPSEYRASRTSFGR